MWPFVVLLWKLPRWIVRHRSWGLFLGIIQGLAVVLGDLRYNVLTKSLAFIAALFIISTDWAVLILPSALYVAVLYFWSFWRRLRQLLGAPTFVDVQRRAIRRVRDSKLVESVITVGDEYLASGIEKYDSTQANQVQMTIAYGIGLNKMLLIWAYQLDRYRGRKRPAFVFTVLTYVWVLLAAVLALTLLNTALLKLDPQQFQTAGPRPLIAVLVYSVSTFSLNSAGGMEPVGELAYALQLLGFLTGLFILAGVGLNLLTTYLRERDDTATQELVVELQDEADRQAKRFADTYELSPDEAYRKLQELGATAASLVGFLVQALPADWSGGKRCSPTAEPEAPAVE
jgi:hypothetical protein